MLWVPWHVVDEARRSRVVVCGQLDTTDAHHLLYAGMRRRNEQPAIIEHHVYIRAINRCLTEHGYGEAYLGEDCFLTNHLSYLRPALFVYADKVK